MIWKRYLLILSLGLGFFVLETFKPDNLVFMPTVTNTHITKTPDREISGVYSSNKVMSEVRAKASGQTASTYPLHKNILTTVFWVGEEASADNSFIANDVSAWDSAWVAHFGGVDDPNSRNGYYPSSFTPKENPFYFALPYGDYNETGLKSNIGQIYWYKSFPANTSLLKNRWIKITYGNKVAYGQWEDVGPYEDDDINYVFGSSAPKQSVGLDVSPAIRDYLGLTGLNRTSWQFVEESQVPTGPWKNIVTRSNPFWN